MTYLTNAMAFVGAMTVLASLLILSYKIACAVGRFLRPQFVYVIRREDDGISLHAFYRSSDADRFCLDSPERLTYYGVRVK